MKKLVVTAALSMMLMGLAGCGLKQQQDVPEFNVPERKEVEETTPTKAVEPTAELKPTVEPTKVVTEEPKATPTVAVEATEEVKPTTAPVTEPTTIPAEEPTKEPETTEEAEQETEEEYDYVFWVRTNSISSIYNESLKTEMASNGHLILNYTFHSNPEEIAPLYANIAGIEYTTPLDTMYRVYKVARAEYGIECEKTELADNALCYSIASEDKSLFVHLITVVNEDSMYTISVQSDTASGDPNFDHISYEDKKAFAIQLYEYIEKYPQRIEDAFAKGGRFNIYSIY